jgi:hypothetical protein
MNCCAKESAINKKKEKPKKEIEEKISSGFFQNSDLNRIETPAVDKELESKFYTAFNKPAEKKQSNKTLEKHAYVLTNIEKNNHVFNGCPDSSIIINYKYPKEKKITYFFFPLIFFRFKAIKDLKQLRK